MTRTMGYSLRCFIAEDDGTLTRVPAAKYHRWFSGGEALPADRAGRELKLLEVVAEMDRHRVVDVLRILPFRHRVGADGRLDASAATRLAVKRLDISWRVGAGDVGAQIEELEADANHFWSLTDAQLTVLGALLLRRPPGPARLAELRAVVVSPGGALRDG